MTWRERIVAMRTERRGATVQEQALLHNFRTCLVGEQAAKGVLPLNWWAMAMRDDERYLRLLDLGYRARDLGHPDEIEGFLDQIEDEAMKIKRELTA